MARYKPYDVDQGKFIPVSFRDQILPGSFEHALNEIVEAHLDLTAFEDRYENDETAKVHGGQVLHHRMIAQDLTPRLDPEIACKT